MNNTDRLCMGCMNDNGGETVCPICGFDASAPHDKNYIAPSTWMDDRFLVGRVWETNGEGATYIGWDNVNNNVVYIKEYFPQGLCERKSDGTIAITEGKEYDFNAGIMRFIEISKTVATLSELPSIMPVVATLEKNGTAYSIIKASAGITLREFLMRNGGILKWEQAKPLFFPLITTLDGLARSGIYHCGISPETIIVGRDGKLHLFGISIPGLRIATSEYNSQIFPGFAAIEQYNADSKITPRTDVYGLAATLFRVLVGNPPMAANERIVHDNMTIPAKIAETIPPYVLTALANALQIDPENRTEDMTAFRAALTAPEHSPKSGNDSETEVTPEESKKYIALSAGITGGILLLVAVILVFTVFRTQIFGEKKTGENSSIEAPSVASFGDTDKTLSDEPVEKRYTVPKFIGTPYFDVIDNVEYSQIYTFNLKGTEFSKDIPEGCVVSQSVAAGESVKRGTQIDLIVSAGTEDLKIPSVAGKTRNEAYLALLEAGFLKSNIEFVEKYDDQKEPLIVISAEPSEGKSVSRYAKIIVFINSYTEPDESLDTFSSHPSSQKNSTSH